MRTQFPPNMQAWWPEIRLVDFALSRIIFTNTLRCGKDRKQNICWGTKKSLSILKHSCIKSLINSKTLGGQFKIQNLSWENPVQHNVWPPARVWRDSQWKAKSSTSSPYVWGCPIPTEGLKYASSRINAEFKKQSKIILVDVLCLVNTFTVRMI